MRQAADPATATTAAVAAHDLMFSVLPSLRRSWSATCCRPPPTNRRSHPCRTCRLQIAQFAAELERYPQAIKIYEEVARTCVDNSLLKYRCPCWITCCNLLELAGSGAARFCAEVAGMQACMCAQQPAQAQVRGHGCRCLQAQAACRNDSVRA